MNLLNHNSFKDMMNDVVDHGSCCECGSCVVVCPHNVIEYIDGKPKQTAKESAAFDFCGVSEGAGCDVCATACPRLWPRESHLKDAVFGPGPERGFEDIFGVFKHIFVARTKRPDLAEAGQDGGIVTALLAWARETGRIDGAVVSAVGAEDKPCFPTPKVVTTYDEIKSSAGSWYTYCANNLALNEVEERDLKQVAFVGVPCQITPLRKMEHMDPSFLVRDAKKPKIIGRQRGFLRGYSDRVAFSVGLFCTEVFQPELMTERIEKQMGIPLTEIRQFNVKGEVLIYRKNGDIGRIPLEEAMHEYQRPECKHCGDFSAEMADIACGGVGTDRATIVVLRTEKAVEIWREFQATGEVEVEPIKDNKRAWNVLLRLARRQRERPPIGTARGGAAPDLPQYDKGQDRALALSRLTGKLSPAEVEANLAAAYGDESAPPEIMGYIAGTPIPGDPGDPGAGEKRKLPPPLSPEAGGAPPGWTG
ncbi:MAG: Coenzyme F420 hydrogenase/dehydrogenase, beta subunit C-terminal domain [Gammaproteobacteria bacterium]|nr:Coenzyme F420 hydrogenase/dehydrogenase, beta subunit C-terminal domain [Gammaproteobacteria bacterium]